MEISTGNKFGTLKGVFIPSILTILGVILFLRLGWVVGQAGFISTVIIIVLSSVITFITALSISTRASDSDIGAGGSYFLVSRCFGLEPGAAIGVPLYLAQALGISFYSVGFAESIQRFFPDLNIKWVAIATLIALTVVTFISSGLALKVQGFILAAIGLALVSFWFGTPYDGLMHGLGDSSSPGPLGVKVGFWEIFAVFFPAVTGIEAGISMSGDLEKPRRSLPVGTIAAVVVGAVIYIFTAYIFHRLIPGDMLLGRSFELMTEVALVSYLVFIGLWGATLSSTVGALLGAPRTLQALAKDKILPAFLAKGTKETNEPRNATIFSFLIAIVGVFLGDLNTIASVLSMFFLTSYGALNLVSGFEELIDNPSWRPSFRVPWFVSFAGAFLCFGAMFMINSGYSFIALGAVVCIYLVVKKRKVEANYSDIRSGLILHFTRSFIYQLDQLDFNVRNWRPNFLVLSGAPKSRMHLAQLADAISHKKGFITVASVLKGQVDHDKMHNFEQSIRHFLEKNNIKSLTKVVSADHFLEGVSGLINNYGLGVVRPNTVIVGDTSNPEKLPDQVGIIKACAEDNKNILLVKDDASTAGLFERGGKTIDVWWRGKEGNADLMLTLAYMLKISEKWKRSRLVLKSIVEDEEEKNGITNNISQFLKKSRIPADFEVIVRGEHSPLYYINQSSKNADLVFLGLKHPDKVDNYEDYYSDFVNRKCDLKTVIYVLTCEKVSFTEIFG